VVGTKKRTPRETEKSVKKTVVKKVRQQKSAAPLTEKIEKETVRGADGCLENAALSKVRLEKEVGRQVLGNDKMAAQSSGAVETKTVQDGNDAKGKWPLESAARE